MQKSIVVLASCYFSEFVQKRVSSTFYQREPTFNFTTEKTFIPIAKVFLDLYTS